MSKPNTYLGLMLGAFMREFLDSWSRERFLGVGCGFTVSPSFGLLEQRQYTIQAGS